MGANGPFGPIDRERPKEEIVLQHPMDPLQVYDRLCYNALEALITG
ncbi:hypothetical protein SAMN04488097_0903 [Epilithonimonas lactis]|nr:hypothetical protein SAMN04488097_0903 [Epilithonimonas lactis]